MTHFRARYHCPTCGATRAGALRRPVEPGDLMVCARCFTLLRAPDPEHQDAQPAAVEISYLRGEERVYAELLIAAAQVTRQREKAQNN